MGTRGTLTGTAITTACAVMWLAGCAGPAATPDTAAPVPAPTVTVSVTPTPTPSPTQDTITCDTAFTADLLAKFENDGLTFRGAEQTETVDALVGDDGLRCRWGKPQTDIIASYANWSRGAADWEALKSELLDIGYIETGPFAVNLPMSDYTSAYSYRDGVIHFAAPALFIGWVSALQ